MRSPLQFAFVTVVLGAGMAIGGCTSLLGDFTVSDSTSVDGSTPDGGTQTVDAGPDGTAPPLEGGNCPAGYADCDLDPTNGCEAKLDGPKTCGKCGHDCTQLAHVSGSGVACNAGACSVPSSACAPGFAHCSSQPDDGCEADLSQTAHCGSCTTTCSGTTPVCAGAPGTGFACSSGCPSNTPTLCSGSCVDLTSNAQHCHDCTNACPSVTNGQPACISSVCGFTCNSGYADCDGMASNGCEVNLTTDPSHCGGCNTPCSLPNATATCASSTCAVASCSFGFGNCNNIASDGCEANLESDTSHCGGCTTQCNSAFACVNSACTCSGALPNLCSGTCVNTQSDASNCGTCGHGCLGGTCSGGLCQPITLHPADSTRGSSVQTDGSSVWWSSGTTGGTVRKCPVAGCNGAPTTLMSGLSYPYTILITGGNLFVDQLTGNIVDNANNSTGVIGYTATGQSQPEGLAVDGSFHLFWGTSNFVMRSADYAFDTPVQMITGTAQVTGLSYDAPSAQLFATDQGPPGRVLSCNATSTCGNSPNVLATNQPTPNGITTSSGRVFWVNIGTAPGFIDGGLSTCSTTVGACTPSVIATGSTYGNATAVTADASFVYWGSANSGSIYKYPVGGGQVTLVANGQSSIGGITNDSSAVYWVRTDGAVMRVAK